MPTNNEPRSKMQAPIIHCKGEQADIAWQEHSALLKAAAEAPTLADRPEFIVLRQDAYARFHNAFGGVS